MCKTILFRNITRCTQRKKPELRKYTKKNEISVSGGFSVSADSHGQDEVIASNCLKSARTHTACLHQAHTKFSESPSSSAQFCVPTLYTRDSKSANDSPPTARNILSLATVAVSPSSHSVFLHPLLFTGWVFVCLFCCF